MKKTPILILVLILLLISVVSASDYTLKYNETGDFKHGCDDGSNGFCSVVTNCTLTLFDPDMNLLIDADDMTRQSSYYNYTIDSSNLTTKGEYEGIMICVGDAYYDEFTIGVSPEGFEPSLVQGLGYFVLLTISVIFMILCLYLVMNIDGRNEFTMGGDLVKINYAKYLQIFMFAMAYMFLIFVNYLSWQIADKFLILDSLAVLFKILFTILWIFAIPLLIALVVFGFVKWLLDTKLHKLQLRNLKPRGRMR